MLKNKPYDKSLDVWCLGILLYELLHGGPPFKGKTDTEKINNIKKNAEITYSSSISKEVGVIDQQSIDLISKLLKVEPRERLTMAQIFNHPWIHHYEKAFNINMEDLIPGFESMRQGFSNYTSPKKEVRFDLSPQYSPGYPNMTGAGNLSKKPAGVFGNNGAAGRFSTPQSDKQPQEPKKSFIDKVADFFGCGNSNS